MGYRIEVVSSRSNDHSEWDFSFMDDGPGVIQVDPVTPPMKNAQGRSEWDFSFVNVNHQKSYDVRTVKGGEESKRDFSFLGGEDNKATAELLATEQNQSSDELASRIDADSGSAHEVVNVEVAADADVDLFVDEQLMGPTHKGDLPAGDKGEDNPHFFTAATFSADGHSSYADPDHQQKRNAALNDSDEEHLGRRLGPFKLLTVCAHNRTRSVMMMAMLQAGFDRMLGRGAVLVRSLGFGPEGEPAIDDAVSEMAARGLDVSGHRSMKVNERRVEPAHLIFTAERDHSVQIAEVAPQAFDRTFTLPEFCRAALADPVPGARTLNDWLKALSSGRTPLSYFAANAPGIDDPTGSAHRQFASATKTIETMCDTVVGLLSPVIAQSRVE